MEQCHLDSERIQGASPLFSLALLSDDSIHAFRNDTRFELFFMVWIFFVRLTLFGFPVIW